MILQNIINRHLLAFHKQHGKNIPAHLSEYIKQMMQETATQNLSDFITWHNLKHPTAYINPKQAQEYQQQNPLK